MSSPNREKRKEEEEEGEVVVFEIQMIRQSGIVQHLPTGAQVQ